MGAGFDMGFGLGGRMYEQNLARKEQLSDEERLQKANQFQGLLTQLHQNQQNYDPNSPEFKTINSQIEKISNDFSDLYHPSQGPHVFSQLGQFLSRHMHPDAYAEAHPASVSAPSPGPINLPAQGDFGGAPAFVPGYRPPPVALAKQTPGTLKQIAAQHVADAYAAATPPSQELLLARAADQRRKTLGAQGIGSNDQQQTIGAMLGVPVLKHSYAQLAGTLDGQGAYLDYDRDTGEYFRPGTDTPLTGEELATWQPATKFPNNEEMLYIRDMFGLGPTDAPTREQMDQGMAAYKQAHTPTVTTTREGTVYDAQGGAHLTRFTNTSTRKFGGGGGAGVPPSNQAAQTPPSTPPSTQSPASSSGDRAVLAQSARPQGYGSAVGAPDPTAAKIKHLRTQANAVAPRPQARIPWNGHGIDPNVMPGYTHATPAISQAQKDHDGAVSLVSLADEAARARTSSLDQALIASITVANDKRYNQTGAEALRNNQGLMNRIAQERNKVFSGGQLPDDVRNQLVALAHTVERSKKAELDAAMGGGASSSGNTKPGDPLGVL